MAENIVKTDDATFSKLIETGVVLVDFYADWCGPCRMLTPILEALAEEMKKNVTVVKLDVDHDPKTTETFQISSVPTLILFKNGKEVNRIIGLKDLETLKKIVTEALQEASDFLMSARFSPFWLMRAKYVRPLLSIVCGLTYFARMSQNHQKSGES